MNAMHKMGKEERAQLFDQYLEMCDAGNREKADDILIRIPLSPWLAKVVKKRLGIQYMREAGFNLSDAVDAFGMEWLDG